MVRRTPSLRESLIVRGLFVASFAGAFLGSWYVWDWVTR